MIKKILAWFKPKQTVIGLFSDMIMPLTSKSENRYRMILNNGNDYVYMSFGCVAEMHKGIRLNPTGFYDYDTNQMNPIIFVTSNKKIELEIVEW